MARFFDAKHAKKIGIRNAKCGISLLEVVIPHSEFRIPNLSILYKPVLPVAQAKQLAASEKEEDLVVPDQLPEDAAHAHLVLGGEFLADDGGVLVGLFHLVLLEGHLHDLIAKIDKGDALGMVAAVHHHVDSVSEFLIVIEELYGIGVDGHIC